MPPSRKPAPTCSGCGDYRVESIIPVDERGQMVLPKQLREKAGIRAGDRMALVSWTKAGRICCISLVKVEELDEMVAGFLASLSEVAESDK